jgi:hypothetical protein
MKILKAMLEFFSKITINLFIEILHFNNFIIFKFPFKFF